MHEREYHDVLRKRLREPRRYIQVIAGPRQVGKTTAIVSVLKDYANESLYVSCDDPDLHDRTWLEQQWAIARLRSRRSPGFVFAVDGIQKVPKWSETVKRLWDEDTRQGDGPKIILSGSSTLLVGAGLSESLAGRFELIRASHWTFSEMQTAFGWDLDTYIAYGGYPGTASLIDDPERWRRYVSDSLIEATISKDILNMRRVDKPALLRQLFVLGARYSGQIVSYQKLVGQLQDAGNTTTLAHYLTLLEDSRLMKGLQKHTRQPIRTRSSSPKLMVLNTALQSVHYLGGLSSLRKDPSTWGRLVESAVGAHLCNSVEGTPVQVEYWRERNHEVDFVLRGAMGLVAIEVKSGRRKEALGGMETFLRRYPDTRPYLIGGDGLGIEEFLWTDPRELF